MRATVFILVLLVLFFPGASFGHPGTMLTFRGPLRDRDGKPMKGPLELTFRIYDAPIGGNLTFGPFGPSRVTPVGGVVDATFGPVSLDSYDGGRRWLEISAGGSVLRRLELDKVYSDQVDRHGALSGGRTLQAVDPEALTPSVTERSMYDFTTILDNGPPANRLDLVFLGDGYTASELGAYAASVDRLLGGLLALEPFSRYRPYFNVHRVDVISNESGIDGDPTCDVLKDTALNMSLPCFQNLLYIDLSKVYPAAIAAPDPDQILVLANSIWGGGVGYSGGNVAAMGGEYPGLAAHELGHSLGDLADEYYTSGVTYSGPEPVEANVSTYDAARMAQAGIKWARWLGTDQRPLWDGPTGTYEGGRYAEFGIYRPSAQSRMRFTSEPFDLPSVEGLILRIYEFVHTIDDATPSGTVLDQYTEAFVTPLQPSGYPHAIQWKLDGVPIPGATAATFRPSLYNLELGQHTLSATVTDTTSWVRDEAARARWMTDSRSWMIEIGDRSPRLTAPSEASVDEGALVSFEVSATDPDGDPVTSFTAAGTAISGGATFTPNAQNSAGTFQWTPTFTQAGIYNVDFTASNLLSRSASTVIFVRNVNRPPVVTAPATAVGDEGTLFTVDVSAADPDAEHVTLVADQVPANAWFEDYANNTARLGWPLNFDEAGEYVVHFTGTDGLGASGTAATVMTVRDVDRAPVVTAPAGHTIHEGQLLAFDVTAADPDGNPIAGMTASGLPPGAVFDADPLAASGSFAWTPSFTQAGTHAVTFTAFNALGGTAVTSILVLDVSQPPMVIAPSVVDGVEGAPLAFAVTAFDPDGEPIDSLEAAPLPPGASFVANAEKSGGTFAWTPDYSQAGFHSVTLSARSACRAQTVSGPIDKECEVGTAAVAIQIGNTDRAPVVTSPAAVVGAEGDLMAFTVTAADPDGDPVASLEAAGLPFGSSFAPSPDRSTGAFTWTPTFAQAGEYHVEFTAANLLSAGAATEITVLEQNRAPVADAGGPYSGVAGIPVTFDGSGSADPDGDELVYDWAFGDGLLGGGLAPSHAYAAGGAYSVVLTVSDQGTPGLQGSATTTASISAYLEAGAHTTSDNRTIRLGSSKPVWCARIEPVGENFRVEDLDLAATVLRYGTGDILALAEKSGGLGDQDKNGTLELEVCFGKTDLRALFAALPSGRTTVSVAIEGPLSSGARVRGVMPVDVQGSAGLVGSLSPNPFLTDATLTFSTTVPGKARVAVYDVQGRLLRVLLDEDRLSEGYHDVRIPGGAAAEGRLASGIYYYRITAAEGVAVGKFTVLK